MLPFALTGQADLIASGNKRDLLPLGSYETIPILIVQRARGSAAARGKKQDLTLEYRQRAAIATMDARRPKVDPSLPRPPTQPARAA